MDNTLIKYYSENDIRDILKEVKDPEIPSISIVDLGIVTKVVVSDKNDVHVVLTPTFAGCPALKIMEELVKERLEKETKIGNVSVETSFEVTWTTDLITDDGRKALLKHGLAPPKQNVGYMELDVLSDTPCPYCSSRNTTLKSPFGPTLCRSLHYCNNCMQAFEGFKPV
jgi:ring-1,2-phenylacetyl-CoA epoxidase subunit PaaD